MIQLFPLLEFKPVRLLINMVRGKKRNNINVFVMDVFILNDKELKTST